MLTTTTPTTTNLHFLFRAKPSKTLNYLSSTTTPHSSTTNNTDAGLLFRKKLVYLASLKINPHKALTQNPNLRSAPLSSLHAVERCLSSMGLRRPAIGRVLDMHPSLLTSDPYLHLYPILDFLFNEVKIPFPDIHKSISRCPRILTSNVKTQLRPAFVFLKDIGFVGPNAINSQTTVLLVYNIECTLMAKIEYLMSLGFEFGEVKRMVVRSPGILTMSVERNLRPKVEYFVGEMEGDLRELKLFPQFFSFSLDGKIKPRYRMLVEHGLKVSLSDMLKVSDGEFNARLIEMRLRIVGER